MKISMWTQFFSALSPEEAITSLFACGYDHAELSYEHLSELARREGSPAEIASAFRKHADAIGISIEQAHLSIPYNFVDDDTAAREASISGFSRELAIATRMGVRAAIIHLAGSKKHLYSSLSREEVFSMQLDGVSHLVKVIDENGGTGKIRLAIENLHNEFVTAAPIVRFIEKSGFEDYLGICLDTGHLNMAPAWQPAAPWEALEEGENVTNNDQVRFIKTAGKHLIALHIADNLGAHDDHRYPLWGTVNWPSVAKALREIGYDGHYNYEVPGESYAIRSKLQGLPQSTVSAVLTASAKYGVELSRAIFG